MNTTRDERRAANRAAHAALTAEYRSLRREVQAELLANFKQQRDTGGTVSWSRFLEIGLLMLPESARENR